MSWTYDNIITVYGSNEKRSHSLLCMLLLIPLLKDNIITSRVAVAVKLVKLRASGGTTLELLVFESSTATDDCNTDSIKL